MLPEVTLRDISRDDVDRVAWWLEVDEISSRWFGHYGCGDPVHRGYDPKHMLEAPDVEWESVFNDPHRLIYSIVNEHDEHIGECQVTLDNEGGAEISLLIGRKDLWHRGYGTSTVMTLMDKTFDELGLDRTWVNVPEDNAPALGLFMKLGFELEATRELCRRPDGTAVNGRILAMDADTYHMRKPAVPRPGSALASVVTVSGLPGSGAEGLGAALAERLGYRFLDHDILEDTCKRLKRTPAEVESLEASLRSFWTRLLEAIVLPMEWSAAYDASYHWYRSDSELDYDFPGDSLNREQYVQALSGVVRMFAAQGDVVLAGRGCHLFTPDSTDPLHVFVSASPETRSQRVPQLDGLDSGEALEGLKRLDRDAQSIFRGMFRCEMLDSGRYDVTMNLDRMSPETAANGLAGMLDGHAAFAPSVGAAIARALTPD